jgi:hypothetical protein
MVKEAKKPSKTSGLIFKIIYIVVLVAAIGAFGFYFIKYRQINSKYAEAILTQDQRNQRTISEVAKIMDLPKDETPVIFAVQDKNKLGNATVTKTFFDKTQNNDVILAYQKANISIIYRPSEKRIVKTDNYTNFMAAANPIKIAILAPSGRQADIEKSILDKVLNADVIAKLEPKSNPDHSYIADATGQNTAAAKELGVKLGLPVSELPSDETKPEGAALIVVITSQSTPSSTSSGQ